MQLTFSCTEATYKHIEKTLSAARLARYLQAAKGEKHHALRLYVWNARICEALYLPTQICEVAIRNSIQLALADKFGADWTQNGAFRATLPSRLTEHLDDVRQSERSAYGTKTTIDHIVSGLSFGFWVHMLTQNYGSVLWPKYYGLCFPKMPRSTKVHELQTKVNKVRTCRNRIAHHKPVFDRSPSAEYQNMLLLLEWIDEDTRWICNSLSQVSSTINDRPSN